MKGNAMHQYHFTHFMIDIETLSVKKNAAIVSIGAVQFDPWGAENPEDQPKIGETLFLKVCPQKTKERQEGIYGDVDPSVLAWWETQPEDIRAVNFCKPNDEDALSLPDALVELSKFIKFVTERNRISKACVWGNGSSFDIAILEDAYSRCGFNAPWHYANVRDTRTMKWIADSLYGVMAINRKPEDIRLKHTPVADATSQCKYVSAVCGALRDSIIASDQYFPNPEDQLVSWLDNTPYRNNP
jgi:hypothetical protein